MRLRPILLATLLLGGCVRYAPQPLDPASAAAQLTGERLGGKLWTLPALEEEAVRRQPAVAVARAEYSTAHAAIVTAGESPNPTVSISPQAPVELRNFLTGTYAIDFDWTVETAGKRSRRLVVAHENARAAAARLLEAEWKARALARQALLDLYAAEERTRLLQEAITEQAALLGMLNERVLAGAEGRSIAFQPRLLQAQLRLQAADAQRAAALARVSLAEVLGMGASGLAGARFSFAEFQRAPRTVFSPRRWALTHRADIVAALADYAASEGTCGWRSLNNIPISISTRATPSTAMSSKWQVGIGLTLPILNQNRGAIGEAEGKRREAAARFNSVQAKALAECDRAAASLHAARAKVGVADELLREQGKTLESEQQLLAAGAGDKLGLRTATVERATTRAARLDALVEWQAALGALEEATQSRLP